jgi:uncharacterized membrane protein (DUF4010 family)
MKQLLEFLPLEGRQILLVLFLSFLIGLEREEHKATSAHYGFGGVRTFPLIALIGYALALLSGNNLLPVAIGFAVVGGFMMLSYRHKLRSAEAAGVTTEISGLATYLLGPLVYYEHYWIAATLVVISLLLLELKQGLQTLAQRVAPDEILPFTKFLLLTAVILPTLPNEDFTTFQLNPFKTWLVVVAVSGISYASYVLQKLTEGRGGIVLTAVLGGAYSSTVTTVALAKRAHSDGGTYLFAGSILIASGMMYLRLVVLVGLFNSTLAGVLAAPFLMLAAVALAVGWLVTRRARSSGQPQTRQLAKQNPLALRAAFQFAALFLAVVVVTRLALQHLGQGAVYTVASVMGVTDVDPFILGMTESVRQTTPLVLAATSILIATASNNIVKGVYAFVFARDEAGTLSLALLIGLGLLGLAPLLWIHP